MEKIKQLSFVTHVLVVALALSIPLFLFNGTLFSWHPSLMAVGFLGLMTEGILTSISFRDLEGNERTKRIWIHLSWQLASLLLIIGGFATIFQNKVNNDKAHFQTLHGRFGVATFSIALFTALGGALGFRKLGVLNKLPDRLQSVVKAVHRNVGLGVWLLALFTMELALIHQAVWKGMLSNAWRLGTAGLAGLILWRLYLEKQQGRRKLPVYGLNGKYDIVTAADELSKTT